MTSKAKEITCLSDALRLTQEARSLQEVIDFRDKTLTPDRFRQQADLSGNIIDQASVVRLCAERRLGEVLREMELAKGSPGNQYTGQLERSQDANGPSG